MLTARTCTAMVALVAGMVLLFEGTYPTIGGYADGIYVAVGAGLILGYFPLIRAPLELKFQAQRNAIFIPVFLVLGLLMLYYGTTKPGLATLTLRSTFIIPGAALVVVSLIFLGRTISTSRWTGGRYGGKSTWRTHRRESGTSHIVAVLVILAFSAGTAFGALALGRVIGEIGAGQGAGDLRLEGVRKASTHIAAVDSQGNGLLCDLSVKVELGDGKVFYRIQPYAQVDLQYSAETAAEVATRTAGVNLESVDVSFEIDASTQIIGGPSAGVAMTVITYAAIENRQIRDDAVITGEIRPDGSIGPVGELIAKAEAAADAGMMLFLVPPGQSRIVTYRQVTQQGPFLWKITYEPVIVDLNEYAEQQGWSLEIREVSTVGEAIDLMLA